MTLWTLESIHGNCVEAGDCWEWAGAYGVSQHTISAIRMNRRWKEYDNNPFAGLGAR